MNDAELVQWHKKRKEGNERETAIRVVIKVKSWSLIKYRDKQFEVKDGVTKKKKYVTQTRLEAQGGQRPSH